MTTINCMWRVNQGWWCQELYSTKNRGAVRRAKQLSKLGYQVELTNIGSLLGTERTTVVHIRQGVNADTRTLPPTFEHPDQGEKKHG